jgi:hypothetical protein
MRRMEGGSQILLDLPPGSALTMMGKGVTIHYQIHEFAELAGVTVKALRQEVFQ